MFSLVHPIPPFSFQIKNLAFDPVALLIVALLLGASLFGSCVVAMGATVPFFLFSQ